MSNEEDEEVEPSFKVGGSGDEDLLDIPEDMALDFGLDEEDPDGDR